MSKKIRKDNLIITIYDGFGKARIEGIYGKPSELVIPNKISYYNKEYNIESVSWEALKYGSEQVESLIIDKEIIENYDLCDLCSLKSITIGKNVKSIDTEFIPQKHLTSIVVNPNNKTYDSRNNCNAIIETCSNALVVGCKNTIIPNSVTSIGRGAFWGCFDLTSITIPNSVKSIGYNAFSSCAGLTSITIPNSVKSIGYNAFSGCAGLSAITFDCDIDYSTKIESTTIRSINIGKNVKKIYPECLNYPSRNSIIVDDKNSTYDSANNCNAIIETSNKTLLLGCPYTKIPNHIISIGKYAFSKCSLLTRITIPSNITSIGDFAFSESPLKSIIIPISVTEIGSCVFAKCMNISITIENSKKNINFKNPRESWINQVKFTLIDLETLIGSIIAYVVKIEEQSKKSKIIPNNPIKRRNANKEIVLSSLSPKTAATTSAEGQMTIAQLAADFKNQFGSVLRVYNGRSKADDSLTLQEVGLTGNIVPPFDGNQKVGDFIAQMKTIGLKVKVYTCDEWIACIDGLTLSATGKVTKYACKADMEKML